MQHHPELERNLIRLLTDDLTNKKILDIGCGKGSWGHLARSLPGGRKAVIHGIEIYKPAANYLNSLGIYNNVFIQDLIQLNPAKTGRYDYVFCFEVLEHLSKTDSVMLLEKLEKIAKQMIFISTPNGKKMRESIDSNKHSAHLCGWSANELTRRGYQVEGLGFKLEPKDHEQHFWYLCHYGMTPLTRHFPKLSNTLFAYLNTRRK
jgi:2-polyprenyl-3-methyl-5-hydroxy-6-metoxy-1,4-benzoquinol methylase